jgi:protein SCO1/2
MSGRGPTVWLATTAVALALPLAACGDEAELAGVLREPPLSVATVSLPEASGEQVPMTAPPGELLLVYFGYTSCPDVCPTTMSDISRALDGLDPDLAARVTATMVTVDPERDTEEVLATYLDHFFDKSYALRTTDERELAAAAAAFGVQWEVADHPAGATDYDVAHTATTYVVDDTGTVVLEWPFGLDSASMTSDLRILFEERT